MAAGRARIRREALADLLRELGPASPTLCAGWTAHDLAAHLVTRERIPWAAPGLVIGALHGVTERAERATMRTHSFPELVEMFRAGPPWWNPTRFGPLDDAGNLIEFYVHAEDLRRAAPGYVPPAPVPPASVTLEPTLAEQTAGGGSTAGSTAGNSAGNSARPAGATAPADALSADRGVMWAALRLIGLAGFRHSDVGVVAERTDAPGRITLRRREPVVEIVGLPEELLLFAYGRRHAARVELRGDPAVVAELTGHPV